MKTYQVKDWNIHFENDRSRARERCSFVCVPNKQHGMGFCRIMAEQDGATIYGVWHMILGACSQQSLPRNGWLTVDGKPAVTKQGADGEQTVTAWGAEDMALKFRRPVKEIERAIEVLTSDKVAWLIAHSPPTHRQVTADSPPTHLERREEKEENRTERKGSVGVGFCLGDAQDRLSRLFKRNTQSQWTYAEQSALCELIRRPEFEAELALVELFKSKPESYFPQSLQSLLSRWSETVDRANNYEENQSTKPEAKKKPKSIFEQEIAKL